MQVYVRIDASVYDVSKMYVGNRSGKGNRMQVIVRVRGSQMDRYLDSQLSVQRSCVCACVVIA